MAYGDEIARLLRRRGIRYLMHFTPAQNLPSIIRHGILPRADLEAQNLAFCYPDEWRTGRGLYATCLSIEWYNWPMLQRVMKDSPGVNWIALGIDAQILVGSRCEFYATNSASAEYKFARGKGTLAAFEAMFEDKNPPPRFDGGTYRSVYGMLPKHPTDQQAEVMFYGKIRPESILFAMTDHQRIAKVVDAQLSGLPGPERTTYLGAFGPRQFLDDVAPGD